MNTITIGTFDLLHVGHIELFKKCRELAGDSKFIVGLNTDEFIFKYKKNNPIMTYEERKEIILSLNICDGVLPNSQPDGTVKDIVLCAGADLIVIGSDWAKKDYLKQIGLTYEWLEEKNISLCYVPYTKGISTSTIKQRLKDQK
jgi:glycerol-3-phosphate cytidylyltransferase